MPFAASGHGTELGKKVPILIKWDSTRQMSPNGSEYRPSHDQTLHPFSPVDIDTERRENEAYPTIPIVNPQRLQRKLVKLHDIDRLCKPQNLVRYNPISSGIKYNVLGLFGIPEIADPSKPCVYAVLASVFPPGAPYETKPKGSMFGANFFTDIDFEKSLNNSQNQFFKQEENDVELSGIILKLTANSSLVLDIKKMDLNNGQITDYGFAI